ncbi:MAG: adenosylcobinamide-GDP ribazoletransferase [Pseudomonadota bacterium]
MAKPDSLLNDLLIAFHLLSRLPLPAADWGSKTRPPARAAWAYPCVGLVTGAASALIAWSALSLGIGAPVAAGLALASGIVITGAMHEDGLADCADGFWGGWEAARRLEIMKDSQIGTYGVLALVIVIGVKWMALSTILATGSLWLLLIAPILSRAAMVVVMERLAHARASGLSKSTGKPGARAMWLAMALGAAAAFGLGLWSGLLLMGIAVCVTLCIMALAKRKIGGQTGDVLGATQSCTDAALLVTLAALAP